MFRILRTLCHLAPTPQVLRTETWAANRVYPWVTGHGSDLRVVADLNIGSIDGGFAGEPLTWAMFQSRGAGHVFNSGAERRAAECSAHLGSDVATVVERVELVWFAGFGVDSGGTHRIGPPRARFGRPWEAPSISTLRET